MTAASLGAQGLNGRWFSGRTRRPTAQVQLFCLPYAGAGASAFRAWPAAFSERVEVLAVQLPGRENRFREPPAIDTAAVAAAIAGQADRPYAIFGHSLGGRLGFEVVRALRRAGRPLPVRLFPSGSRPPDIDVDGPFDGLSDVTDDELIARLTVGGGVPAAVLDEPEVLQLLLPVLRADLRWIDDYTFVEEPPLPVPLTVFAGEADRVVLVEQMAGWQRHTTAGCTVHTLPGGHFFLHDQLASLVRLIEANLLEAVAGSGP